MIAAALRLIDAGLSVPGQSSFTLAADHVFEGNIRARDTGQFPDRSRGFGDHNCS